MATGIEVTIGNPVLSVVGEIDLATVETLMVALRPRVERGGPVIVDLSEVTFLDSTGIRVLAEAAAELGERGCLVIHGAHGPVARVLEITQLDLTRTNIHVLGCTVLAPAA